jgi:N-acetylneuraminic acid mutarotase
MRKSFASLFVFFSSAIMILGAASTAVTAQTASVDSWIAKSSMPTERVGLNAAVVNGVVYAMGGVHYEMISGRSTQAPTTANEVYYPVTDAWAPKASMPVALTRFGIAVFENKIYCIGGVTNEVYDSMTETWQLLTPMPTPRSHLQANVVDGKIYLIGGNEVENGPPEYSVLNEVYDPATDTWTSKSSSPLPIASYASTVADHKIYIFSGLTKNGNTTKVTDAVQVYDPQSDIWSQVTSIPTPVQTAAAATLHTNGTETAIFIFGGVTQDDPIHATNLTQIYYPEKDSWEFGAGLLYARAGLAGVVVDNTIFAVGGGQNSFFNPQSNTNQQYGPNITQNSNNPTPKPAQTSTSNETPKLSPSASPIIQQTTKSNSPLIPSPSIPEFPFLSVFAFLSIVLAYVILTKRRVCQR